MRGPAGMDPSAQALDKGTLAQRNNLPPPSPKAPPPAKEPLIPLDDDTRYLAATAYGEASTKNDFDEVSGIANVLIRQSRARGFKSVASFIKKNKTFAFAAHDGNPRYSKFMAAKDAARAADAGMAAAIRAARSALSGLQATDPSSGAYFWDGADIKSDYETHKTVRAGFRFTKPAHNIYGIKAKDVPGENWWLDKDGKKTKLRGKWTCKFESTAAHGGTIFWKYTAEFIDATGNTEYD